MAEELEVEISPDGIKVEAKGYKGGMCLKDLEKIVQGLAGLGITMEQTEQQKKPEFYQSARNTQQQRLGG